MSVAAEQGDIQPAKVSYRAATVRAVRDLTTLAAEVSDFAAASNMTVIPAVPARDLGHEVCIDPARLDLAGFLALATKLGGQVLYVDAEPFDPARSAREPDVPAEWAQYEGMIGLVAVAFVTNGVVHHWERITSWYEEWEDLSAAGTTRQPAWRGGSDGDEHGQIDEVTRVRQVAEAADRLVAMPEFRAAKATTRQRIGERRCSQDGVDSILIWECVRAASERVAEETRTRYDEIYEQLDDLADQLLDEPQYRAAASAPAKRQVIEQFLTTRADGLCPPTLVRDELYARAQQRAKAGAKLF